jgi:hypothetical protein
MVEDIDPAMCGSETYTMVVSSTSMNVASITAQAISHGFAEGRHCAAEASGRSEEGEADAEDIWVVALWRG